MSKGLVRGAACQCSTWFGSYDRCSPLKSGGAVSLGSDVSLITSDSQHQLSEIMTCKERSHSIRKLGQAVHYLLSTPHGTVLYQGCHLGYEGLIAVEVVPNNESDH